MVDPLTRIILDKYSKLHVGVGRVITYEGFEKAMAELTKRRNQAMLSIIKTEDTDISITADFRKSFQK